MYLKIPLPTDCLNTTVYVFPTPTIHPTQAANRILAYLTTLITSGDDTDGRADSGVGLLLHYRWNCEFEPHRRHGRLSLVSVVFCQVEVSASG
jgi:hypothetical protein